MGTKEVVVSHPEGNAIEGAIGAGIAISDTIGKLEGTIEPLNHLLGPTILGGNLVIVCKSNDLNEFKVLIFSEEFLLCQGIGSKAVCDELDGILRELRKFFKGHAHGKDTGTC